MTAIAAASNHATTLFVPAAMPVNVAVELNQLSSGEGPHAGNSDTENGSDFEVSGDDAGPIECRTDWTAYSSDGQSSTCHRLGVPAWSTAPYKEVPWPRPNHRTE